MSARSLHCDVSSPPLPDWGAPGRAEGPCDLSAGSEFAHSPLGWVPFRLPMGPAMSETEMLVSGWR